MNQLSVIFIGTGEIGADLIKSLNKDDRFNIELVITKPDKPAGRKMKIMPSPIKTAALDLGLKIYQPENVNSDESLKKIKNINPDMIILMAYGQILGRKLLGIPKFGCINIHASLLPKYRGASPIQQSLLNHDSVTGISIMEMEEKMDTGPVFEMFKIQISDEDDSITISDKLGKLAAEKAPDVLTAIAEHRAEVKTQDNSIATYCKKITKSDGKINWSERANIIEKKIRAFTGWPGSFTFWNKKRLKVLSAKTYNYPGEEPPGKVIRKNHDVIVMAGHNAIKLMEVQLEGRNAQSIDEFIKGYTNFIGSQLM